MNTPAGLASTNHDIDVKIFHSAVEYFFDGHRKTVDLIDKENIPRL